MGILVLGSKVADEFFAKQDHHALGTLAHQAAVSLARAQLVDRLQGQIHEIQALTKQVIALQERNQKRLSQELHDDVAQDLAFVLRLLEEPVERKLAIHLLRFSEAVLGAANNYRPNYLADYLYELAQIYSTFYQTVPFLKAEEGVRESRVRLCDMVAKVLRTGLDLLGIETPERI